MCGGGQSEFSEVSVNSSASLTHDARHCTRCRTEVQNTGGTLSSQLIPFLSKMDSKFSLSVQYLGGRCYAVVGSGREENRNTRYPRAAGLAQPSGLTLDSSKRLYFADSESSSIRRVITESGVVEGVVGGYIDPQNLFAFGDKDGKTLDAQLQHPLDVAFCSEDEKVYVADTYNHKLKRIDPLEKTCTTVIDDGNTQLDEPGGICSHGSMVYIADTNNHCIRVYNVNSNTMNRVSLRWSGSKTITVPVESCSTGSCVVNPHGEIELSVHLNLSQGVKLTEGAPSKWVLLIHGDKLISGDTKEFTLNPVWRFGSRSLGIPQAVAKCRLFLCVGDLCTVREIALPVDLIYDDTAPIFAKHNIIHTLTV